MSSRVVRVHPDLLDDVRAAIDYYREQDSTLPARFVDAYVDALNRVEEYPLAGREYLHGYRRGGRAVSVPARLYGRR